MAEQEHLQLQLETGSAEKQQPRRDLQPQEEDLCQVEQRRGQQPQEHRGWELEGRSVAQEGLISE